MVNTVPLRPQQLRCPFRSANLILQRFFIIIVRVPKFFKGNSIALQYLFLQLFLLLLFQEQRIILVQHRQSNSQINIGLLIQKWIGSGGTAGRESEYRNESEEKITLHPRSSGFFGFRGLSLISSIKKLSGVSSI